MAKPQTLQNDISNQCLEMQPQVGPLISIYFREADNKYFVFAEIPGIDLALRPCYYRGKGIEQAEYPIMAIREAILNALVHRDYSIHTEGMPVQLLMFNDRLEIRNPGGLYGRISVNELGKIRSDTRNPLLATMLETLHLTENRYSGIPIMREECRKLGLHEPVFKDNRGEFCVIFYNEKTGKKLEPANNLSASEKALLEWCHVPRSRKEIAEHLALASVDYAFKTYAQPLIEKGLLNLTIPDKPRSSRQRYVSNIK